MQCHGHGGYSEDVPETFVVYWGSRLIRNGMTQKRRERYSRELYARFAIFDSIMAAHTNGVQNTSPYAPSDFELFQPEVRETMYRVKTF